MEKHVKTKAFNFNLESLRGVAAIIVVWGHIIFLNSRIDPEYYPKNIFAYAAPAHISVLIFFILSGYVIGLVHPVALTPYEIITYLKKRFVRIYPIYFLCLLLAILVSKQIYPITTIISHLTMTQGILSPVITSFAPSWSLTYEVIFYILFIPISYFKIDPFKIAVISGVVGLLNVYLYPKYGSPLLASYSFGFVFWLTGLILITHLRNVPTKSSYAVMLSLLFLFLSIENLDGMLTIFSRISLCFLGRDLSRLPLDQPGAILVRDFLYLPYCLILIIAFIGYDFKFLRVIHLLLAILPAITFYSYYKHKEYLETNPLLLTVIFYALSFVILIFAKRLEYLGEWIIRKLIITGSVSYGIYIIHFPILYAIGNVRFFTGTYLSFTMRILLLITLSLICSYSLEKRFQPWIKTKLLG